MGIGAIRSTSPACSAAIRAASSRIGRTTIASPSARRASSLVRLEHHPLVLRPRDELERARCRWAWWRSPPCRRRWCAWARASGRTARPGAPAAGSPGLGDTFTVKDPRSRCGDRAELRDDGGLGLRIDGAVEVNLTASALKSSPLWNFTPLRSANCQVVGFSRFQDWRGPAPGCPGRRGRQPVVDVGDEDLGVAPDGQVRIEGVRLGREADLDLAGRRGGGPSSPRSPAAAAVSPRDAQRVAPGHRSVILGHVRSSQAPVRRPLTSTMTLRNVFVPMFRAARAAGCPGSSA